MYLYDQIALAIARAITDHTRTSKSTNYYPYSTTLLDPAMYAHR